MFYICTELIFRAQSTGVTELFIHISQEVKFNIIVKYSLF